MNRETPTPDLFDRFVEEITEHPFRAACRIVLEPFYPLRVTTARLARRDAPSGLELTRRLVDSANALTLDAGKLFVYGTALGYGLSEVYRVATSY